MRCWVILSGGARVSLAREQVAVNTVLLYDSIYDVSKDDQYHAHDQSWICYISFSSCSYAISKLSQTISVK